MNNINKMKTCSCFFATKKKTITCKWIYKRKLEINGGLDQFKARLVPWGCQQKQGFDYFETYALMAK
jgi:hypothetical protein